QNRKLADYLPLVQKVFPQAAKEGGVIVATNGGGRGAYGRALWGLAEIARYERTLFDEHAHPRADDGKFATSGAKGGSNPKPPKKFTAGQAAKPAQPKTAGALEVPSTELNRAIHDQLRDVKDWTRPIDLFRQHKGKTNLLEFMTELRAMVASGEVDAKGKRDNFQIRPIETESALTDDTKKRLKESHVPYNPNQMMLFRKPGTREIYRKVLDDRENAAYARKIKSRPGQGTFNWNEDDHPRDEGGQFAEKDGVTGSSDDPSDTEGPEFPEENGTTGDVTGDVTEGGVTTAAEDWKANGTKSAAFKGWFGDWEDDPQNASKVVDENGEPEQQHSMVVDENGQPKKAYHGTSHGGWNTFEPRFGQASAGGNADHLLYGPGFYFTEDRGIAEEYTQIAREPEYSLAMDEDAANAELRDRVEAVAEASDDEMLVEEAGDVMRDIDSGRYGVHKMVGKSKSQHDYFASTFGIDVSDLFEEKDDSEVKELYLNIRKPFDADNDRIPASPAMKKTLERYIRESEEQGYTSEANEWREKLREGYTYQEALGFKPTKEALNEYLTELGYDGITHIGGRHLGSRDHQVWIAFQPNQIKSTDNQGTFDPDDNRMSYRKVKDRAGQGHFSWDEDDHPRDQAGKFTSGAGVTGDVTDGGVTGHELDTIDTVDIDPRMEEAIRLMGSGTGEGNYGSDATLAIHELTDEAATVAIQAGHSETAVRRVQSHTHAVISRMNTNCRMRIARNVEKYEYHPDLNDLTRRFNFLNMKNRRLGTIGGFYTMDERQLNLNGAYEEDTAIGRGGATETAEGIQAHEFAHAIDGPKFVLSNMRDWIAAWMDEIVTHSDRPPTLTKYAMTDAQEGFAEFGRLLFSETEYSQAAGRETIRVTFPKCYKFWIKMRLIDD
nr:hypothetical protein [bacterium]